MLNLLFMNQLKLCYLIYEYYIVKDYWLFLINFSISDMVQREINGVLLRN